MWERTKRVINSYLEELIEHLQALTPRLRQGQQRAPKQYHHFADVLKHKCRRFRQTDPTGSGLGVQVSPAPAGRAATIVLRVV